ncbi:MAG: transcription elongation factor GreA [Phycisphaerales bacterium]|nr:MAG: transcription elongation factor GreA [Phycisphaerales bacterium]
MEFMTPAERDQIKSRLDELIARRPEISLRIAEARALGDLKENGDYHAAREDQAMEEAEIKRLEQRLSNAKVVEEGATPSDMIFLGATVRLRDTETGEEDLFKLVGEATGDLMAEHVEVTVSSPMGESLLKARVGETVRVDAPRGVKRFEVVEIL